MRVLILHEALPADARTDESDVFAQASAVESALRELGHESERLGIDLDLATARREIARRAPDLVFNLVEALGRTGRLVHVATSLLEVLRIPYAGCPDAAMYLTSNKPLGKRLLALHGIATPAMFTLDELRADPPIEAGEWIVKSTFEEGSIGLDEDSVIEAHSARDLRVALESRLSALGGEGFVERYVDGREFNLSVFGYAATPRVLPPAEIVFEGYGPNKKKVVGFRAKWDESSYEYHHTPRRFDFPASDAPLLADLRELAERVWRVFGLAGWARVDFRVDAANRCYVLESNANPCLSPDAGFQAALARAGIPWRVAVEAILDAARPTSEASS